MSDGTRIGWADASWNVTTGCLPDYPCWARCYARTMAKRLQAMGQARYRQGFAPAFHADVLAEPLRWRKPRRVFVSSMGDLFAQGITNEQIAAVFGVMAACPQHRFLVLTKRPERAGEWYRWVASRHDYDGPVRPLEVCWVHAVEHLPRLDIREFDTWPLPNVWLGTSISTQADADARLPHLLQCPAAVRFVSAEPLLGPIHLDNGETSWLSCHGHKIDGECCASFADHGSHFRGLDWVIVGGESGPSARPMHLDWVREIRDQCAADGVPFFYKQADRVLAGQALEHGLPTIDGVPHVAYPEGR